jgi:hypothetical protein
VLYPLSYEGPTKNLTLQRVEDEEFAHLIAAIDGDDRALVLEQDDPSITRARGSVRLQAEGSGGGDPAVVSDRYLYTLVLASRDPHHRRSRRLARDLDPARPRGQ